MNYFTGEKSTNKFYDSYMLVRFPNWLGRISSKKVSKTSSQAIFHFIWITKAPCVVCLNLILKISTWVQNPVKGALPSFDRGLGLIMNNLSLLLLRLHNFFQLSNKFGHGAGRQALRSWNIQRGIRSGAIFNFGQRRPGGGGGEVGATWRVAGCMHFCSSSLPLTVLHSGRSSNFFLPRSDQGGDWRGLIGQLGCRDYQEGHWDGDEDGDYQGGHWWANRRPVVHFRPLVDSVNRCKLQLDCQNWRRTCALPHKPLFCKNNKNAHFGFTDSKKTQFWRPD